MPWPLRMIMYANAIQLVILIYFGIKYFLSIKTAGFRSNKKPFWIFAIPAALFFTYPILGYLQFQFTGSFSSTGYPHLIIYLFWFGLIYLGTMLSWMVTLDVSHLLSKLFIKKNKGKIKRFFAKSFLVIAAIMLFYTGSKLIWDTHRITTEEITFTLSNSDLPDEPITIVHIADLHADQFTDRTKTARYVDKINKQNPDIVVFAGDLITSGRGYIEAGAEALGNIQATHGVFAVMGDHDYWVDQQVIANALQEQGIHALLDENRWLQHNGIDIKITGVTELYSRRVPSEKLHELFQESRNEQLSILASHQASGRLVEYAQEYNIDQLLAGHTHGGQIRIPIFFYPVTAAMAETPYVNGSWWLGDMLLNINNGLGFTLAPLRYNAPAQVSVIKIE